MVTTYLASFFGKKSRRVALLEFEPSLASRELWRGFADFFSEQPGIPFSCKIFSARANQALFSELIREIIDHNVDLICAQGTIAVVEALKALNEHRSEIPLLFINVAYHQIYDVVTLHQRPIRTLSGLVWFDDNYYERVEHIKKLLPHAQQMITLGEFVGRSCQDGRVQFLEALRQSGCEIKEIIITQQPSFRILLEEEIVKKRPQVITLFRDPKVMHSFPLIRDLADHYKIPLFASDLASVAAGAALGYGFSEWHVGYQAAQKAHAMIEEGSRKGLPISFHQRSYELRLNRSGLKTQEVHLSAQAYTWFFQQQGKVL